MKWNFILNVILSVASFPSDNSLCKQRSDYVNIMNEWCMKEGKKVRGKLYAGVAVNGELKALMNDLEDWVKGISHLSCQALCEIWWWREFGWWEEVGGWLRKEKADVEGNKVMVMDWGEGCDYSQLRHCKIDGSCLEMNRCGIAREMKRTVVGPQLHESLEKLSIFFLLNVFSS